MQPNLLDKDKFVKNKWLEPKYNKTICRFLKDLKCYIYDLIEYNTKPQFYHKTSFASYVLDNIIIFDTEYGLIIEYDDTSQYRVGYYSYSNTDEDYKNIEYVEEW